MTDERKGVNGMEKDYTKQEAITALERLCHIFEGYRGGVCDTCERVIESATGLIDIFNDDDDIDGIADIDELIDGVSEALRNLEEECGEQEEVPDPTQEETQEGTD